MDFGCGLYEGMTQCLTAVMTTSKYGTLDATVTSFTTTTYTDGRKHDV